MFKIGITNNSVEKRFKKYIKNIKIINTKIFEDGKKVEVDFYVKGNYIPIVTVEQENIEQNIDTLVQEITLQNFKIEEKKQIIALAYAINVMDNKISENERSIAQLRIDKEEIEKEFAGILKSINAYKKVSI